MALSQIKRNEAGFTLIESVVAMGLFVGVVFLLISVYNEFVLDDFVAKSNRALSIAEDEISSVERTKSSESTARDTIGFHIIRTVTLPMVRAKGLSASGGDAPSAQMKERFAFVDVTVESVVRGTQPDADVPMVLKKPRTLYVNLSKVIPIR